MRIDLNARTPQTAESGATSSTETKARRAAARPVVEGDHAQISSEASRVSELASAASQYPEIRHDKVNSLAAAVQRGTYDVSPDKTADVMISEMLARSSVIR